MSYMFSKTPESPTRNLCPARQNEPHESANVSGSSFDRMFPRVHTDDGGCVELLPCRYCSGVYWNIRSKAGSGKRHEALMEQ